MHWEGGRKTCLSNSSRLILPSPFMSIVSIRASHEDNFNCQESTSNMKQQKTIVNIDSANWWSKTCGLELSKSVYQGIILLLHLQ
jgi:hypothetical protein